MSLTNEVTKEVKPNSPQHSMRNLKLEILKLIREFEKTHTGFRIMGDMGIVREMGGNAEYVTFSVVVEP